MNTKMKELKSLKASNNNILVGLYLDSKFHEGQLAQCLYGLANQEYPIDVVVLDGGLTDKDLESLTKIASKPTIRVLKNNEEGNPIEEVVEADKALEINIVKTEVSNFSQIFNDIFNLALNNDYESFSIIEVGDAVGANWYSIANTYAEENEEIGFFLPMVRSFKNGVLTGLMNEAAWADGMSEEAGKFDMNLLLKFNCANPLGGVYRVKSLEEYSEEIDGRYLPMKESVKISHYYEFFLRMIYNDVKMMTIPRVGYDFRVNDVKEFSHSSSKVPANITVIPAYKGGIDAGETSFWVELAKKEYFFDEDRCKTFSKAI